MTDRDEPNPTNTGREAPESEDHVGPLGDISASSAPLGGAPDDIAFYDAAEWMNLDDSSKSGIVNAIKSQFDYILSEVENIGDGASEQSTSLANRKTNFKMGLIGLTALVAMLNFFGSAFSDLTQKISMVSGTIAILITALGSVDSFFSSGEKSVNMAELHYRCRDVIINLRSRWAAGVLDQPDFKSYRNAFKALDSAQRELQQINKLAKKIVHEGEGKSAHPSTG